MKVMVGIPTLGRIRLEIVNWLLQQNNIVFHGSIDSNKASNANKVITRFLKTDCTHLLMMDDDIEPDLELIDRLIGFDKDVVAGCPVIFNKFEKRFKIAAFKKAGKIFHNLGLTGKLEKVDYIGGGCIMIKRKVLEKIEPPWFNIILEKDGVNRIFADQYFSDQVTKNGFELYADCTRSLGQYSMGQELLDILQAVDNEVGRRIKQIRKKSKGR